MKLFIINDRMPDLNSIARILTATEYKEKIEMIHHTDTSVHDLIQKLKAAKVPERDLVLLLDLEIDGDREGGIKIAKQLAEHSLIVKIIIMTGAPRDVVMAKVLQTQGLVAGYVEYEELEPELNSIVSVINKVQAGERDVLNDRALKHVLRHYRAVTNQPTPEGPVLEPIETKFLELLAQGYKHDKIKEMLGAQTQRRPDRMVEDLATRLGLQGKTPNISIRLVARAVQLGLIKPQHLIL